MQPPTERPRPPSALAVWAGLLTLYLVWGSTYLGIRLAIETIPPYLMGAARFLLAGGILLAWNAVRGNLRPLPTLREWRDSAIVGTLLLCGGMGLVALAEQTVASGVVALLIALMPAWVAVLGRIFFRERLVPLVVVGLVVGLVGVAILVAPSLVESGPGTLDPLGLGLAIVSPILWAGGSLYSAHRARLPRIPSLASALQMLTAGVVAVVIGAALGELGSFHAERLTGQSVAALVYLVTVGSIVGFGAYVWLLRVAPIAKVTTYAYVNPVVAFVLGAIVLGEPVSPATVVAAAVIVAGVVLIVTARGRSPHAVEETAMAEAEGAAGARPGLPASDEPSSAG